MKKILISKPGEICITECEMPVPKDGEVLLKIKYCGICGSDVATYTGNQPFASYPRTPGHEFSAEIVKICGDAPHLKEGMIVTANPYFNCGSCYPCTKGNINCCEDNQTMGVQREGSFAEYITMPIERVVDGRGLSAKLLAMIEPFSIGYHAINRAEIKKGDKVLVLGAGPIGIFAALSAKIKGAEVYVTDILDKRLEMAKMLGADGVINCKTEDLTKRVMELTDGNGMDVCVEAAGTPETFMMAIDEASFAGKMVLVGNTKRETTFNHSALVKKELNIYGSRNSLHDFEPLVDIVLNNKVNIEPLITNIYDLENAAEAFDALKNNDGSMAKVLVKF